jgi:hypothetical protein
MSDVGSGSFRAPWMALSFLAARRGYFLALLLVCLPPARVMAGGGEDALTPERLRMRRSDMVFSDRALRLFNGRGAISVRDRTVTGLQAAYFPPIELRDYRFQLSFREQRTGLLIGDNVQDLYEALVATGRGAHPLGANVWKSSPLAVLVQDAVWQPGAYHRTGTFHKILGGKLVSFALDSRAVVSADRDHVYLELRIHNRQPEPLTLTLVPQQSASELRLAYPNEKSLPAVPVRRPDAFTLENDRVRVHVVSDGWTLTIPGQEKRLARFAILFQVLPAPATALDPAQLGGLIERAYSAVRERLRWAGEALPRVSTSNREFDDLYYRSILSVLESRWDRENFVVRPFYAVGNWTFTIPWDTSFASELLSLLDPAGLRETFLTYIRAGVLKSSWIPWNGKADASWYAQNPFAEMRILQDYLAQTGDLAFLDHSEGGTTVFEWMKRMGRDMVTRFGRPDGLLDFGEGSEKMLEIRTEGYQHVVAATNGMAVAYFRQVAAWCRARKDADAAWFDEHADRLQKSMREKLWDAKAGWFDNLYPDGTRHQVWSYHLFDLLDSGSLTAPQRRAMTAHLREGEFLAPYGMYSMSRRDLVHWDLEDVDFGGGGQYPGMPLRIAEALYRSGDAGLAWNILARCARWTRMYPYISQQIFGANGAHAEVDMPLEISAGGGAQAILFGTFGLRPAPDGSLVVAPAYHASLGAARMTGYRFRGHTYAVTLEAQGYKVFRDGKPVANNPYTVRYRTSPGKVQ